MEELRNGAWGKLEGWKFSVYIFNWDILGNSREEPCEPLPWKKGKPWEVVEPGKIEAMKPWGKGCKEHWAQSCDEDLTQGHGSICWWDFLLSWKWGYKWSGRRVESQEGADPSRSRIAVSREQRRRKVCYAMPSHETLYRLVSHSCVSQLNKLLKCFNLEFYLVLWLDHEAGSHEHWILFLSLPLSVNHDQALSLPMPQFYPFLSLVYSQIVYHHIQTWYNHVQ